MIGPIYSSQGIMIFQGDCRMILPHVKTVDHMITDAPYSAHVHANGRSGSSSKVSKARPLGFDPLTDQLMLEVCLWAARAVQRWSLAFTDVESAHLWRASFVDAGLEHIRTGAWIKKGAPPQFTGDRPAMGFEAIEIAHRPGRKKWNGGGKHALWTHPIVRGNRNHTAEKPLGLMVELIQQFTDVGETIIDPFAGSGTTLVAAKMLGRRCIGIEREAEHVAKIVERCELTKREVALGSAT